MQGMDDILTKFFETRKVADREAASCVGVPARASVIHVLKRSQMENKTTECSKSNAIDIFDYQRQ